MWHVAAGVSSANTHLVFLCNTLNTQNCWNPHCFHCRVAFSRGPSCNICSWSCIHKNCIPRMLLCWQYVSWQNGFQESSRFSILHRICYISTFHHAFLSYVLPFPSEHISFHIDHIFLSVVLPPCLGDHLPLFLAVMWRYPWPSWLIPSDLLPPLLIKRKGNLSNRGCSCCPPCTCPRGGTWWRPPGGSWWRPPGKTLSGLHPFSSGVQL